MIMLYGSQQDYDVLSGLPTDKPPMTAEQVAAMHAHMEKVHQALAESGELVDARGLSAPAHARRVQLTGGVPVVTDGPYPETHEVLAGYTIVECASFDRATEIAAGFVDPDAAGGYVDVRPVLDGFEDLAG
ncbi:YciI family protein [Micromonospora sp. NPDC094482]|uniref:YciI family protein n=1 Tax=unclassified Micromonospora TaxID=2617518 RepID=UPI00332012AB